MLTDIATIGYLQEPETEDLRVSIATLGYWVLSIAPGIPGPFYAGAAATMDQFPVGAIAACEPFTIATALNANPYLPGSVN